MKPKNVLFSLDKKVLLKFYGHHSWTQVSHSDNLKKKKVAIANFPLDKAVCLNGLTLQRFIPAYVTLYMSQTI